MFVTPSKLSILDNKNRRPSVSSNKGASPAKIPLQVKEGEGEKERGERWGEMGRERERVKRE